MTDEEDDQEGIKGAVEEWKGRLKEAAGSIFGTDETPRDGRAQEEGVARQEVAEREREADLARERAAAEEARQRSEQ
jgi:uncharacterized protein YjbJ (UPF0337 family)